MSPNEQWDDGYDLERQQRWDAGENQERAYRRWTLRWMFDQFTLEMALQMFGIKSDARTLSEQSLRSNQRVALL